VLATEDDRGRKVDGVASLNAASAGPSRCSAGRPLTTVCAKGRLACQSQSATSTMWQRLDDFPPSSKLGWTARAPRARSTPSEALLPTSMTRFARS
jgi:hypothetical protein